MKLNHKEILKNIKSKFHSIRIKLFATLCAVVAIIVLFLIVLNSIVLETYYIYTKQSVLLSAYKLINDYYNQSISTGSIEIQLEKLSLSNDFDILIKTDTSIYSTTKDFISTLVDVENSKRKGIDENILYNGDEAKIRLTVDKQTDLTFILLSATLDNGYQLYIRTAVASIQESVKIANKFLIFMGFLATIVSGVLALMIARRFTAPIEELNKITSKISELDFSHKYRINDSEDELNNLRKEHKYNVRNARKNNKAA